MGAIAAKLQPWAAAKLAELKETEASGHFVVTPLNRCMPSAVPGTGIVGGSIYGLEILVEPRQVTFLYGLDRNIRFIYIDQDHPAGLAPSWMGHSVGRWEGDTLVTDTIGFNDENAVANGIPITRKMHVVERLSMVNGQLEDRATFDHPGALTGSFEITNRFERAAPFQEYICAENNRFGGVATSTGQPTPNLVGK